MGNKWGQTLLTFVAYWYSQKFPLSFGTKPSTGVANAARTRDLLNHNQVLYRLSYSHHGESTRIADQCNR